MDILSWIIYAVVLGIIGLISKRFGEEKIRKAFEDLLDRIAYMIGMIQGVMEVLRELEEFLGKLEEVMRKAEEGELKKEDIDALIKEGKDIIARVKLSNSETAIAWEKLNMRIQALNLKP